MAPLPTRSLRRRLRAAWRGIPLARQLFLAMFGSMFGATSIYFLFDIYATNRRLLAMERSTLTAVFPILQGLIEDSMVSADPARVRDLFAAPARDPGGPRMFLLDRDKKAVDLKDLGAGRPPRRVARPDFDHAGYMVMDFPLSSQPACVRCHGKDAGLLGYVRLASEHQERVRSIAAHFRTHLAVLAATMVLLGISALVIVRRLVQAPLERIVEAMAKVSRGELQTRIADVSSGELGAIAAGFNAMVSDLERDRRRILELHRRQVAHMERLAAVGELSAQLAHEVRNPLTGIGSAVQVLQQEHSREDRHSKVLSRILTQLQRMDQIMANFLSFARMPEAVSRPFELKEPLSRVFFLIEPRLRAQGISLRQGGLDGLPPLTGDPGQLEQVFLNVCLNAIQAMPKGGVLALEPRLEASGAVTLEFRDTGHGIAPENLEHVFKPFFTTRDKGSGLGLPISRQIVLAHEGEMWIESVPGNGTSVFVRLPAGAAAPEPA